MAVATKPVWSGAKALRRFLVPIDALEPFPDNPRRGDVAAIAASLSRFGQVRAIVVDGSRIVAGHHVVLAATELGWTHVAAIANEFGSDDEARAYLLADNQIPSLGTFDDNALAAHLKTLSALDAFEGTGFVEADLDAVLASLKAAETPRTPRTQRQHRDPGVKELVLSYTEEQLAQVDVWMGIVAQEKGTNGTSETVAAALEVAARTLNQGG